MNKITVKKSSGIIGEIKIPGDKSISHRSIMIGSISNGKTTVKNFLFSEDCLHTISCFKSLGADIKEKSVFLSKNRLIEIQGNGLHGLREPDETLYVGNSGTTIRLICGILSGQNFRSTITGDVSITNRPMKRIIDPLRTMGANIRGEEDDAKAPLLIERGKIKPTTVEMQVASAQVKSCVLLAGLYARGTTTIVEKIPTRDHMERMLEYFGAEIKKDGNKIYITGNPYLTGKPVDVPGDISSAAFFMVGASIIRNSDITMKNIGFNPTRSAIVDILNRMGAHIEVSNERTVSNEPRADIRVKSSTNLRAINLSGAIIPQIIDEIPILVLAATQAQGTSIIKGALELRVKESDRIASMALELRKMGAKIEELEDGLIIHGGTSLRGADCKSHSDHRVAMTLLIAGLIADGETNVEGTEFIETSFPGFEAILK